jgi:hypothetical protein
MKTLECSGEENCQKVKSSSPAKETFDIDIYQRLLKGWWFNPWQDNFKYFLNSMYK